MAVKKALIDFVDRVGSTAVQAFVGALGAAEISGLGDLKSAVIAAVGAALVATVKVVGIQAASAASTLDEPTATADVNTVVQAIAQKLKS